MRRKAQSGFTPSVCWLVLALCTACSNDGPQSPGIGDAGDESGGSSGATSPTDGTAAGSGGRANSGGAVNGGNGAGGKMAGAGGSPGATGGRAGTGASAGSGSGGMANDGGAASNGGTAGGGSSGNGGSGGNGTTANSVWSKLTVMAIENPKDHGAVGDGKADDLAALTNTVAALPPAGGIVYLPEGASFKKANLLVVTKSHVKFWALNRKGELFQTVGGQRRHQSVICRQGTGCGFFGLKLRSDATSRFDALEDNQISADHASLVEIVGCEIQGSAATGVMLYGSKEHYIEGNYIHHAYADHIHHTEAARTSWVWNNYVFNEAPSNGDDGVACVTYHPASPLCGDMEWWRNTILHGGHGRGYSVIGGDHIAIHDNWAIGTGAAGIIIASEGSYDSASSNAIRVTKNYVYQCSHETTSHPGILVSGLNSAAAPLDDLTFENNVSADNASNQGYRAEGAYTNVTNTGLSTMATALPKPIPTLADVKMADTTVLRTRDVSHVDAASRPGLYRIHVRKAPSGGGFEQRFEYVVKGAEPAVAGFIQARQMAGDYLSESRTAGGTSYALVLTSTPVALSGGVSGVPFAELRAGDQSGALSWLWQRVDAGTY
jgi:hypothetical protein